MNQLAGGPANRPNSFELLNRPLAETDSHSTSTQSTPAPLRLAQALEGDPSGPLSRWLQERPSQDLRQAWNGALSPNDREQYAALFGTNGVQALLAISDESDLELMGEALLSLAVRMEASEHPQGADLLYQCVQSLEISSSQGRRARSRLESLQGRGDFWDRAGRFGERVIKEATDPSAIVGMGAAGMLGRVVKLGVLSRLALSPAGTFTRGMMARTLASTAAWAIEAPAFTATTRGANVLLGRHQDWSGHAVWREFAGGATTLLGLKLSGVLGGQLIQRYVQGESLLARVGQTVVSQTAMAAGIYASHRAEEALGFRERVGGSNVWAKVLETWAQFNIAGFLGRKVLGTSFQRREAAMDRRFALLARSAVAAPSLEGSWRLRLAGSASTMASLGACLGGCDVIGHHSSGAGLLAILAGGLGIVAMSRGSSTGDNGPNTLAEPFRHSRSSEIVVNQNRIQLESKAHGPIADRTLTAYENALSNLLEGTEDGFGTLQGEFAERLRGDPELIRSFSMPNEEGVRHQARAAIGPGGHLLGFEWTEIRGSAEFAPELSENKVGDIVIGPRPFSLEARGHRAISSRLFGSYELALRNLIEGNEDDFAMLQGPVAEKMRSDTSLRQRIMQGSGSETPTPRHHALIGPGGNLLQFRITRTLGSFDRIVPESLATNTEVAPSLPETPTVETVQTPVPPQQDASTTPSEEPNSGNLSATAATVLPNSFQSQEFLRYRESIFREIRRLSNLDEAWGEVGRRAETLSRRIEENLGNRTANPYLAYYLQSLLEASRLGASSEAVSSFLNRLELEVEGQEIKPDLTDAWDAWKNQLAPRNSRGRSAEPKIARRSQSAVTQIAPTTRTASLENSPSLPTWRSIKERIAELRDPDQLSALPRPIADAARRALDTLDRLESHHSFSAIDADMLLDRYESIMASETPAFDSLHQIRRAMNQESSTLLRLRDWAQSNPPTPLILQAHRIFQSFFHPVPLLGDRLSDATLSLVSACDSRLSSTVQQTALDQLERSLATGQ